MSRTDDEMKYLHQHLFWRVDKLAVPVDELPHEGEEPWIRIPPDKGCTWYRARDAPRAGNGGEERPGDQRL